MRVNKKTIIHTQPGNAYEVIRAVQHQVKPDHTQERNVPKYSLATGSANKTMPAIIEAIVALRIDVKELSLMLLPEPSVNDVVQLSLSP